MQNALRGGSITEHLKSLGNSAAVPTIACSCNRLPDKLNANKGVGDRAHPRTVEKSLAKQNVQTDGGSDHAASTG